MYFLRSGFEMVICLLLGLNKPVYGIRHLLCRKLFPRVMSTLNCYHPFETVPVLLGKICFVKSVSLLLFLAGSMYQYFVKIVPTMYRKLNGEVSPKKPPLNRMLLLFSSVSQT